jgi:phospholipase B1
LKKFNPKLQGYNTGSKLYLLATEGDGLNVAVSGGQAQDMVTQARWLIERLRSDKRIDFANDWKVATLFIGGNDICAFCKDRDANAPQQYIKEVADALDMLYKDVPRMFVNLVTILNVDEVIIDNPVILLDILIIELNV